MLFFLASQNDPLEGRAEALRAALAKADRSHRESVDPGERMRAIAIAANACYQLSFTEANKLKQLVWLRLAARWANAALEDERMYGSAHPFAEFHARMFGAQALVRAALLS